MSRRSTGSGAHSHTILMPYQPRAKIERSVMHPMSPLVATVAFDLLEAALASDIEVALESVLAAGVVFRGGETPLEIFRGLGGRPSAISKAIRPASSSSGS